MDIHYQDNNLIVTYLQVFLNEYFNITVIKNIPKRKSEQITYEIVSSEPIVVTGYHNPQTYSAIALYMAYNYPNEGFPLKWSLKYPTAEEISSGNNVSWICEPFIYDGTSDSDKELLNIISYNMEHMPHNRDLIMIPERVLSYFYDEVVTPNSSPEEILRIKKLLYETIYADRLHLGVLSYTDELYQTIVAIQQNFIKRYATGYSSTDKEIEWKIEKITDTFNAESREPYSFTDTVDTFNGNGIQTHFELQKVVQNFTRIVVDGKTINETDCYFDALTNQIIFSTAPLEGFQNIIINYTSVQDVSYLLSKKPTNLESMEATVQYGLEEPIPFEDYYYDSNNNVIVIKDSVSFVENEVQLNVSYFANQITINRQDLSVSATLKNREYKITNEDTEHYMFDEGSTLLLVNLEASSEDFEINESTFYVESTDGTPCEIAENGLEYDNGIYKITTTKPIARVISIEILVKEIGLPLKTEYDPISGVLSFIDDVYVNDVININENLYEGVLLPEQYKDFKVTGYVDPWTEIIIKNGVELE